MVDKKWILISTLVILALGSVTLIIQPQEFSIVLDDGQIKAKYSEGLLKVYKDRFIAFEDHIKPFYFNGKGYTTMYKARGTKYSNLSYYKEGETTFVKQTIYYSKGNLTRLFEITEYRIKESFEWIPEDENLRVYFLWTYGKLDEWEEKYVYLDKTKKEKKAVMDFEITNNWENDLDNIVRVERFQNGKLKIRTKVFEGNASFDPEIILKEIKNINYTHTTETHCEDGKCWKALYSGTHFGYEDKKWKPLKELKSFKDSTNIKCVVDFDGKYKAECLDYNLTHRKIKFDASDIPVNQRIGLTIKTMMKNETGEMNEKAKTIKSFVVNPIQEIWMKADFGDEIHFGENSTTIILQDADTENLNDDDIHQSGGSIHCYIDDADFSSYGDSFIMFNISAIPSGRTIENAQLYFHTYTGTITIDAGDVVGCWGVNNHTWNEEDGATISLRTVDGTNIINQTDITSSATWYNWTVTSWVSSEYDNGDKNVSFGFWIFEDADSNDDFTAWCSKEYTTDTSLRPYLNITYSEAGDSINPTSNSPSDASHTQNSAQTIGWILQDETGAGNYTILRNGSTQNTSTSWTNNTNLGVWVNTSTIGNNWNYTIRFNDSSGNEGTQDTVFINITIPTGLKFYSPTPNNGTIVSDEDIKINVSIFEANLSEFGFNWNGTNQTIFTKNTVLILNLNNNSNIGEHNTKIVGSSYYEHEGTIYNGAKIVGGKFKNAINFDGINDYAEIPDNDMFSPSESGTRMTISLWYKIDSENFANNRNGYVNYAGKGNPIDGYEWFFRLYNKSHPTRPQRTSFYAFNSTGGLGAGSYIQDEIEVGEWISITATLNGTHTAIYKNGVLRDTDALSGYGIVMSNTNANLTIGYVDNRSYFNGTIDEFHIYNYTLTAEEIEINYNSEFSKVTDSQYEYFLNHTDTVEGDYTFYAYSEDAFGSKNKTEVREITVDGTHPIVTLNSPENDWGVSGSSIVFNCSLTDKTFLENVSFYWNYSGWNWNETKSITGISNSTTFTKTGLTYSSILWNCYGCDNLSNCGFSVKDFVTYVDDINPIVDFGNQTPANESIIYVNYTQVNISITETNLKTFKLNWNGTVYDVYNDSLVLALNFDNNLDIGENSTHAVDISRYKNHGTMEGTTWSTLGKYKGCMHFNPNNYLNCGADDSLNMSDELTIGVWIKLEVGGETNYVISKRQQSGSAVPFRLHLSSFQRPYFGLYNLTNWTTAESSEVLEIKEWYYLTATYDKNLATDNLKIYLNGVLTGTANYTYGLPINPTQELYIGQYMGDYFNGFMDELRIYNIALSADNILMNYEVNFKKYNSSYWNYYNEITLDTVKGNYTYFGTAIDVGENTINTESRVLVQKDFIDTNFEIWDGNNWVDAYSEYLSFSCSESQTNCQPENQDTVFNISIYRITNNGTKNGGSVQMKLNKTFTNVTLKCDDDNTPAGAINLTTSYQTIHGALNYGTSVDIYCWADLLTNPEGGYFDIYANVTS